MKTDLEFVLRAICVFFLITPQILKDGIGYCYFLKENTSVELRPYLERYTVEAVCNVLSKKPDASVEMIFTEVTGIPIEALCKYSAKVVCEYYVTDKDTQDYLDKLIFALQKVSRK